MTEQQSASAVLMVRPMRFQSNPETAECNKFQGAPDPSTARAEQAAALEEFDGLASALRDAGVEVHIVDDTDEPHTPDSVFPNNWVSFHADGTVVLYPMMAVNRRGERRLDVLEDLSASSGFRVDRTVDLSAHESEGRFLEGTGSLVLDRINRIAYACLSPRTHLDLLGEFGQRLDYDIVVFDAHDAGGTPIYHTNVLMCLGERFAVICAEAIVGETRRKDVLKQLEQGGREVVTIGHEQMSAFAGNMLELENSAGDRLLVMSSRARDSLSESQEARLSKYATLLSTSISQIEDSAGGSVRCMLAEIHLPKKPLTRE